MKAMGTHPSFRPSPGSSGQAVGPAGLSPVPDFWSQTAHPTPPPPALFLSRMHLDGLWPLIVCSEASWATPGGKKRQTQDKAVGAGASVPVNQPGQPEILTTNFSFKWEGHCTLPGSLKLRKWGTSQGFSLCLKWAARRQNHARGSSLSYL